MNDIGSKSALDMSDNDIENAGWNTRASLARNGVVFEAICLPKNHRFDLDEEDGVLYLTCLKCRYTKFLKPQKQENENVRASRYRLRKIRFQSL